MHLSSLRIPRDSSDPRSFMSMPVYQFANPQHPTTHSHQKTTAAFVTSGTSPSPRPNHMPPWKSYSHVWLLSGVYPGFCSRRQNAVGYKAYGGTCTSAFTFSWRRQAFPLPSKKKKIQVNKNINDIAKGSTKILPHMKFLTSLSLFLIL